MIVLTYCFRDAGVALAACLSTAAQQPLHPKCPASLTKILHSTPNQVLRTLELGSGCGIPGKTLASLRRNCLVWLTDIPEAMELLDDNIRISKTAPGSSLSSQVLIWGQELPTDIRQEKFDLVLVSDCTYNTDSIPALVKTLSDLVFQSPSILIVVATKVRHPSERVFFDLMANAGMKEFELVTVALRTGSFEADDDDDQNEYVDIHIFPGSEVSSQASDELGETAGERFIEI